MRTAKANVDWKISKLMAIATTRITTVAVTGIMATVAEKMEISTNTVTAKSANVWILP